MGTCFDKIGFFGNKSGTVIAKTIFSWAHQWERQTNKRIKFFRTNNGKEFVKCTLVEGLMDR
jgi:hypothetical protein